MKAETVAAIRRIMRDEGSAVTPVEGVTNADGYAGKTAELRRLRQCGATIRMRIARQSG
jgi:translation initiation factor 1 (eIF-1/SUI1)